MLKEQVTALQRCFAMSRQLWRRVHSQDRWIGRGLLVAVLLVSADTMLASAASGNTARLCDLAARKASDAWKVPLDVLQAISRAETGRSVGSELHPWPWTVNMEGKGKWFINQDDARAYVFKHFKQGARSFDVGCFQINYKWHGTAFRSIDDMFDPGMNADYAARFLRDLYVEFGDWGAAAGAFHSRTQTHASRYSARFEEIRNAMTTLESLNTPVRDPYGVPAPRQSRDPFSFTSRAPLFGEGTGHLGSLVPVRQAAGSSRQAFVAVN